MSLLDRVLGIPFVYNRVRPLLLGGIDLSPAYELLRASPRDVLLDVGCGTGDALNYVKAFERYVGFDTDARAIDFANKKWSRANVEFNCRLLDAADVRAIAPTCIALIGLLHHLTDDQAIELMKIVQASPTARSIVTLDVVYLPDAPLNNVLASLDRGRYCRQPRGYEWLAEEGGLTVDKSLTIPSAPGREHVRYFVMQLSPPRAH